jgi:hypothetical protein
LDNIKNTGEQILAFKQGEVEPSSIEKKLDEFIALLETNDLDKESLDKIQHKFNSAFKKAELTSRDLKVFRALDNPETSRENLVDNLEKLLSIHQLDSKVSKRILIQERLRRMSLLLISLVMITLGFAMIIMPAPPYFEMFTIFYFNPDDGVTLMDLISLLIVFTGVFLFITSFSKISGAE